MISSLRGILLTTRGSIAVVEVGGVGLAVTLTPEHAVGLKVGGEVSMHTALIVREDDLALFGFKDAEELAVFDLLRGVTGVGPKSAMGVLATMSPAQISTAVALEDDSAFRRVSGIGPKTAKLIVLSLAGKIHVVSPATFGGVADNADSTAGVLAALIGLGWSERVAAQAIADAADSASAPDQQSMQHLLRLSLAQLGPRPHSGVTTP